MTKRHQETVEELREAGYKWDAMHLVDSRTANPKVRMTCGGSVRYVDTYGYLWRLDMAKGCLVPADLKEAIR